MKQLLSLLLQRVWQVKRPWPEIRALASGKKLFSLTQTFFFLLLFGPSLHQRAEIDFSGGWDLTCVRSKETRYSSNWLIKASPLLPTIQVVKCETGKNVLISAKKSLCPDVLCWFSHRKQWKSGLTLTHFWSKSRGRHKFETFHVAGAELLGGMWGSCVIIDKDQIFKLLWALVLSPSAEKTAFLI